MQFSGGDLYASALALNVHFFELRSSKGEILSDALGHFLPLGIVPKS
jgi:hypothetical protein